MVVIKLKINKGKLMSVAMEVFLYSKMKVFLYSQVKV